MGPSDSVASEGHGVDRCEYRVGEHEREREMSEVLDGR